MSEAEQEKRDASYLQGRSQALAGMLSHLGSEFFTDEDTDKARLAHLLAERAQVVAVLRDLCEEFGDNDWPDNLHLTDVLRKHLEPYLAEEYSRSLNQ